MLRLFRWRSTLGTNTHSESYQPIQPVTTSVPSQMSSSTTVQPSSTNGSTSSIGTTSVALNLPSRQNMSSNNLLNSNLSGSFKDSDDEASFQDAHNSVYEPINKSKAGCSRDEINTLDSTSRLVQPSSSQGRLGVAAIPNMEFSPSSPGSKRKPNQFIV